MVDGVLVGVVVEDMVVLIRMGEKEGGKEGSDTDVV